MRPAVARFVPVVVAIVIAQAGPGSSARAQELEVPPLQAGEGLVARVSPGGALTLAEVDAAREGLVLRRARRSDDGPHPGRFGRGWRSRLDDVLARDLPDGHTVEVSPGLHVTRRGAGVRLASDAGGVLDLALDEQGRVARVRGHEVDLRYEYGDDGELLRVRGAGGRARRYEAHGGRVVRVEGAGGWLLRARHDARGRLRALDTPGGARRFEARQGALRMHANGARWTWRLDAAGRPLRAELVWGPGVDERLTARARGPGAVDVDTPWGRFSVERDGAGRALAVSGPFGEVRLGHDELGRRASVERSNGVRTRASAHTVEHAGPAGEVVLRVERRREGDGDQEVTRVTGATRRVVRLTRDAAGRAVDVWTQASDGAEHDVRLVWTGALRGVERDGALEPWVTGDDGRLVAAGDLRLRHDAQGRVVLVEGPPRGDGPEFVVRYDWDQAGRLARVERWAGAGSGGVRAVAYAWSDDGRLLERQDERGTAHVVEGPLVRAVLGPGPRVRLDVLDPDAPRGAPPLAVCVDGAWAFAHDDGAGAVLAWTDARGRRAGQATFSPRGAPEEVPAGDWPLVWAGQEVDETAALVLVGGRPYAPWLGRWLAPDPSARGARAYERDGLVGALGGGASR